MTAVEDRGQRNRLDHGEFVVAAIGWIVEECP